ncbi:hypothetical protein QQF64_001143, partial [Cirrhinus molitorella]
VSKQSKKHLKNEKERRLIQNCGGKTETKKDSWSMRSTNERQTDLKDQWPQPLSVQVTLKKMIS